MKKFRFIFALILTGCLGVPEGVTVIQGFEVQRYLGKWYEIARLDHPFERGLQQISAEYSLNADGSLKVVNSGYNPKTRQTDAAEGKAYFIEEPTQGSLKVSFFGPFYGSYNIIALDKQNYRYAMITGPNRNYLWILARDPVLNQTILEQLVTQAKQLGYATDQLIYVKHS